jgi:hypothetical protein
MAHGTAPQCGRVGSCHIYLKSLSDFFQRGFFGLNFFSRIIHFFVYLLYTSRYYSRKSQERQTKRCEDLQRKAHLPMVVTPKNKILHFLQSVVHPYKCFHCSIVSKAQIGIQFCCGRIAFFGTLPKLTGITALEGHHVFL